MSDSDVSQVVNSKTAGAADSPSFSARIVGPASLHLNDGECLMLAICAEPGLCQGALLSSLIDDVARRGARALRYDLRDKTPDAASALMVKAARHASRLRSVSLVCFDNVPASDEACVRRQARALGRLREAGVSVAFSILPEGSQLLEALPECRVLRSRDLLVGPVLAARWGDGGYWLRELSWGIPSLVEALLSESGDVPEKAVVPRSYYDSLSELVSRSLRLSLSDEELRLRLAAYLLGGGPSADLLRVVGPEARELFDDLRANVPLVELTPSLDEFRVLTGMSEDSLVACLAALGTACSVFPDVCPACVEVLLARGEVERAARLLSLPRVEGAYPSALLHATDLLDAGHTAVLAEALDHTPSADALAPGYRYALRAALGALGEKRVGAGPSRPGDVARAEGASRDLLLFVESRGFLRADPQVVGFSDSGWSELGRRLLAHCEACELMARGKLSAAMRVLVANPPGAAAGSVSTALLCLDFELARLLLGDAPGGSPDETEAASRLLSSGEVSGLRGYVECLELVRGVLVGAPGASGEAASLISRSERRRDTLVQAVSLLAGCVIDLRAGACARAGVRATLSVAIARSAGLDYLGRIASLLCAISRYLLGEAPLRPEGEGRGDDLDEVCALAYEAMDSEDAATERGEEVPREALWLLLVLEEGLGVLSQRLRELTPARWARAMALMRGNWERRLAWEGEGTSPLVGAAPCGGEALGAPPIEVRLLGEFELLVGGTPVLDGRLEHRNAKPMLEYLVLRRGASAKRYQLVEQIWPECDYATGFGRIYQATSVIRSAIGEVRPGLDPFLIGRSTKAVTLDRTLVRCDVDEFRTCAREAADGTDDERVLDMARRSEGLYGGDLYMPSVDATGFVASTREELRRLYVDAMVAGADAALRLGRGRTAVRLATNALETDGMREDAVTSLVRALKASGRNAEADQQYRAYAARLMQAANRPPSKQLRRVVGEGKVRRGTPAVTEVVTA